MTEKEVFIAACGVDDDQNNKSIVKIESKIFHTKNSTEHIPFDALYHDRSPVF